MDDIIALIRWSLAVRRKCVIRAIPVATLSGPTSGRRRHAIEGAHTSGKKFQEKTTWTSGTSGPDRFEGGPSALLRYAGNLCLLASHVLFEKTVKDGVRLGIPLLRHQVLPPTGQCFIPIRGQVRLLLRIPTVHCVNVHNCSSSRGRWNRFWFHSDSKRSSSW